jgi:hypothetical protein
MKYNRNNTTAIQLPERIDSTQAGAYSSSRLVPGSGGNCCQNARGDERILDNATRRKIIYRKFLKF